MVYFNNFTWKFLIVIGMCFFCKNSYAQGGLAVKIDGSQQIVSVWQQPDPISSYLEIAGSYGNSTPPTVIITDPTLEHAFNPILMTSRSNLATNKAVAIWKAYEFSSGNFSIQLSIATSLGWTAGSITTFSDPNEMPSNVYHGDISDDGQVIVVEWLTEIISSGAEMIRRAQTTDGGSNWITYLIGL